MPEPRKKELTPEAREALRLLPFARDAMDVIRAQLPDDTHFGLMVLVPGEKEGRVIALTTDRDVVAPAVARWVMDVLDPNRQEDR